MIFYFSNQNYSNRSRTLNRNRKLNKGWEPWWINFDRYNKMNQFKGIKKILIIQQKKKSENQNQQIDLNLKIFSKI